MSRRGMMRVAGLVALGVAAGALAVSRGYALAEPAPMSVAVGTTTPAELPGLHNVFHLSTKLYSGSVPEGDAGFQSLRGLGIRTILSVDGMQPDTKLAAKYGMRYVHLPFGYDGCPRLNADRIVRAVRDLPGPIYVHCHHGKHRAPVAAAVARIGVDGISNAEALEELKHAGTGTNYTGLYETVRSYHPTAAEINAADTRFVPHAPLTPFVDDMVKIEGRFSRLQAAEKAGWPRGTDRTQTPEHDALQLSELLHELQRPRAFAQRPEDFRKWMADSEEAALTLETALQARDGVRASTALGRIQANCAACHVKYRDVPQK